MNRQNRMKIRSHWSCHTATVARLVQSKLCCWYESVIPHTYFSYTSLQYMLVYIYTTLSCTSAPTSITFQWDWSWAFEAKQSLWHLYDTVLSYITYMYAYWSPTTENTQIPQAPGWFFLFHFIFIFFWWGVGFVVDVSVASSAQRFTDYNSSTPLVISSRFHTQGQHMSGACALWYSWW